MSHIGKFADDNTNKVTFVDVLVFDILLNILTKLFDIHEHISTCVRTMVLYMQISEL